CGTAALGCDECGTAALGCVRPKVEVFRSGRGDFRVRRTTAGGGCATWRTTPGSGRPTNRLWHARWRRTGTGWSGASHRDNGCESNSGPDRSSAGRWFSDPAGAAGAAIAGRPVPRHGRASGRRPGRDARRRPSAGTAGGAGMIRQTLAILVDAYRDLNARKLFWITLILSALIVVAFSLVGVHGNAITIAGYHIDARSPVFIYKSIFSQVVIGAWLTWAATVLALVSTAGIFPD